MSCCSSKSTSVSDSANQGRKHRKYGKNPELGRSLRLSDFDTDLEWTYLNHGSFGLVPVTLVQRRHEKIAEMERMPDAWFPSDNTGRTDESAQALAPEIGAQPEDFVFVECTTRGISNALKSVRWKDGDAILVNDWTYSAMVYASNFVRDYVNATVQVVQMSWRLPIADERDCADQFEDALRANSSIRLALIDHISSMPAVVFPIKELSALCRQYEVVSLIDGAHAPGQVPVNIADYGCDIYVGNLHKWFWSPRGCAIQWVTKELQDTQRATVTATTNHLGWPKDLTYQGTRDDTAYATVKDAIEYFEYLGGQGRVRQYNSQLGDAAVDSLRAGFGDTPRFPVPAEMEAPNMRLVQLPELPGFPKTDSGAAELRLELAERYRIRTVVSHLYDELWLRLSINAYCELADYEKLRDAVIELRDQGQPPSRKIRDLVEYRQKHGLLCGLKGTI